MQFTLREMTAAWAARVTDARVVAIWLAVAAICTLAGPFGTLEAPLAPRGAYWFVSTALAVALSLAVIPPSYDAPALARAPRWTRGLAGALVFSALYSPPLVLLGRWILGADRFPSLAEIFAYVAPVAAAISLIAYLFAARARRADGATNIPPGAVAPAPPSPRLLKRLKPALGPRLIRLSMQDHYVEAVTDRGAQLILMRLTDALEELDGLPGWRIHRSHWVAEAGVAAVLRGDGKTRIRTTDGAELPVSRTYLPTLREAGVIQRFG